jgi:hypothetical protein
MVGTSSIIYQSGGNMCGISSLFHNMKKHDRGIEGTMFNALWTGAIRGHHSTGLIYESEGEVDHFKKAVPGYDFMHLPVVDGLYRNWHKSPYLIAHNRAATRGEVKHSNAHPFQFNHITGVHNGTLSAYHQLTPAGTNHPVDSMYLYDAISREGIADIYSTVQGSFNLLWHDAKDNTIHMCKNTDRPYCFAKLKGEEALIGMSEKPMLKWLIGRHNLDIEYCWTPKNNTEYVWDVANDMIKPAEEIKHQPWVAPAKKPIQQPPQSRSAANTTPFADKRSADFTRIEMTEFFLDTKQMDKHSYTGHPTYTYHGMTLEGEVVMILNCKADQFELETWYTGRGVWVSPVIPNSDHWRLYKDTVKLHPLESPDEAVNICIHCGTDHFDSQGVYVDNSPVCLTCCKQFAIDAERLDDPNDSEKLMQILH